MRKLFAVLTIAMTVSANETSWRSLQSGPAGVTTPLTDRGLRGEGQIVAVLDTGVDYDSCFFAEADKSRPPVNTGSPSGGLASGNVDLTRRKIVAYNFLYSCDQYPGAPGCENPNDPLAWDNTGHGTHNAAAIAGDQAPFLQHDYADAIAPAAKLIVQDGGFIGGDNCSHRPGFGCPVNLTPIFEQAFKQGARIHSNSWGDRQNTPGFFPPPTGNYSPSARDLDAFVAAHPDFLVVFNTGNYGATAAIPPTAPPLMSIAAPGTAKNALQVGGVRPPSYLDDTISYNTLFGPTRDGRIKPDVVGPMMVIAGDSDLQAGTNNCDASLQGPGTSWAAPTVAGAAALVRQYYTEGFYPGGFRFPAHAWTPSAALLKATIIASTRPATFRVTATGLAEALAVPSHEQGFGFPVLDDTLYFDGDTTRLQVVDKPDSDGLTAGSTNTIQVTIAGGSALRVALVWTDPAGVVRSVSDPTAQLVNDLDLRVTGPNGFASWGNDSIHPGQADRRNNVEVVTLPNATAGSYSISVNANRLGEGPRQGYALVVTGAITSSIPAMTSSRLRALRAR